MMAEAARSNWMVSCRLGHVDVVVGITVAGNGVHGVLELLLLLLCSDMFDTKNSTNGSAGAAILSPVASSVSYVGRWR
jgi:hypothetical protein